LRENFDGENKNNLREEREGKEIRHRMSQEIERVEVVKKVGTRFKKKILGKIVPSTRVGGCPEL
jgi:hypothetical protein